MLVNKTGHLNFDFKLKNASRAFSFNRIVTGFALGLWLFGKLEFRFQMSYSVSSHVLISVQDVKRAKEKPHLLEIGNFSHEDERAE